MITDFMSRLMGQETGTAAELRWAGEKERRFKRSNMQIAERLDDLGTLAVGAALSLCHQGKVQILVGEIAAEVNRVLKGRGERQFSSEKVGHRLKKAGLISRRMSAAGNGFQLDHATQVLLHEIAAAYGCVGLTENDKNLHCPLCTENKCVMQVV